MEIPTRIIDNDEYKRAVELELETEGYVGMLALDALVFNPPTEDNDNPRSVYTEHVHIQALPVREACLYIEKRGIDRNPIILLPKYDEYGYDDFKLIHPATTAWGYILSPHGWQLEDKTHDLADAMYFFKGENKETIWA